MNNVDQLDAAEQNLLRILEELRESYEKAAAPYIKRLQQIHSMRPMPQIVLRRDSVDAAWINAQRFEDARVGK